MRYVLGVRLNSHRVRSSFVALECQYKGYAGESPAHDNNPLPGMGRVRMHKLAVTEDQEEPSERARASPMPATLERTA
jgi:hypothetical protein